MDYAPLGNSKLEFEKLVMQGRASRVLPSTDTGYKTYGAGRLFLPAGTNLFTNPSFEIDSNSDGRADGLSVDLASHPGSCSRVAAIGGGSWSQRFQTSGDGAGNPALFTASLSSITAGDSFTASVLASGSLSGCNIAIYLASTSFTENHSTDMALTTTPTRYSVTKTFTGSYANIYVYFIVTNCAGADSCDVTIDNLLVEKSSVLHPYFDGTYDNCAWTGTANASTSTRTVSRLYQPTTNGYFNSGTVALRVVPGYAGNDNAAHDVWSIMNQSLTWGHFLYHRSNNCWTVTITPNSNQVASTAQSFTAGSQHCLVTRWSLGGNIDLNYDGTNAASAANPNSGDSGSIIRLTPEKDGIGSLHSGPCLFSPYRKSDAWTTAIQANSGAALNDPMRLWRDFMEPGDILFPLAGDSVGYMKVAYTSGQPSGLDYSFTTTAATTDTGYEVYDG